MDIINSVRDIDYKMFSTLISNCSDEQLENEITEEIRDLYMFVSGSNTDPENIEAFCNKCFKLIREEEEKRGL